MALTVTHSFVSTKTEQTDPTLVGPNEWNANHSLVGWPFIFAADYNFTQSPGGSLVIGSNAIQLNLASLGVVSNGLVIGYNLRISGGVGTAENVPITQWNSVTGVVTVTCAHTHSGAWSIGTATAGIQEAINTFLPTSGGSPPTGPNSGTGGGIVRIQQGTFNIYNIILLPSNITLLGDNMASCVLVSANANGLIQTVAGTTRSRVEELCLNMNNNAIIGLDVQGTTDGLYRRLLFTNGYTGATAFRFYGTGGYNTAFCVLENFWMENGGDHCVQFNGLGTSGLGGYATWNTVRKGRCSGLVGPVIDFVGNCDTNNVYQLSIVANSLPSNTGYGIYINSGAPTASNDVSNIIIKDILFESGAPATTVPIYIGYSTQNFIDNVINAWTLPYSWYTPVGAVTNTIIRNFSSTTGITNVENLAFASTDSLFAYGAPSTSGRGVIIAHPHNTITLANGANENVPIYCTYNVCSGPNSSFSIGGLVASASGNIDGMLVWIYNYLGSALTINNQDASSTAANRIITGTGGNVTVHQFAMLVYDAISSRWALASYN